MNDLRNTIAHILEHKQRLANANEATLQQYVVLPILRALGWDDANLASMEVLPEHPVEGGSVDYALQIAEKIALLIECKKWNESLDRHEDQIVNYAFKAGVRIVGLTNGKIWRFYFSWIEGRPVSERIICEIDIEDRVSAISDLEKYLLKYNVVSGKVEDDARIALEEKEKTTVSKPSPSDCKTDCVNDIIDKEPIKPETTVTGEWTIARVRDLVPQERMEHYESKYEKRYRTFYKAIADVRNITEEKGWKLNVKFTKELCGFWLKGEDGNKERQIFGIKITFRSPRFFAKIEKREAVRLSDQHQCEVVWYSDRGKAAYYDIPEDLSELLPMLEFAYNKHRRN